MMRRFFAVSIVAVFRIFVFPLSLVQMVVNVEAFGSSPQFSSSSSSSSPGNAANTDTDTDTATTSSIPIPVRQLQFPTQATAPTDVLLAQLEALEEADMEKTFRLFSRVKRLAIEDATRRDVRETNLVPSRVHSSLLQMLSRDCPGLVDHAHGTSRVLSVIGDPCPPKGRLQTRICRVKLKLKLLGTRDNNNNNNNTPPNTSSGSRYYIFTMTRQSPFDGGDPRDNDGYEKCWFVSSIVPEDKDSGGDDDDDDDDDDDPLPSGPEEQSKRRQLVPY